MAHLVAAHVGATAAYSAGRSPTIPAAVFIGIVFSQLSLLATWTTLGSGRWWKRLTGGIASVGYLGFLLCVGISDVSGETFFVVAVATSLVAIPLLAARFFGVAVRLACLECGSSDRIQFSIRDMLILTSVVAFSMSLGRWMPIFHLDVGELLNLLVFGVTFAVVGVLPVWCALAARSPVPFSLAGIAVGAVAGYCMASILGGEVQVWLTATVTEVMIVTGSLLVMRFCGYRLVRLGSSTMEIPREASPRRDLE